VPGAEVVHSEEALFQALEAHSKKGRRIFVAGGGQIYRMLLPYAEVAHITRIWNGYEADTYFPDLDQDPQWVLAESGEEQTYFDLEYRFCRYERTVPGLQPDRNKTGACGV
jgi:dihydrofolate reductase